MISRPPATRIQHSMANAFFYHASADSHPANRRDFFNTHAC
jgi:hypothetical protein